MKRTPLPPRKTPMPRSATGLKRGGALAPVSAKMKQVQAEQKRAYAAAPDAGQGYCLACGQPGETEHSHYLSGCVSMSVASKWRNSIASGSPRRFA